MVCCLEVVVVGVGDKADQGPGTHTRVHASLLASGLLSDLRLKQVAFVFSFATAAAADDHYEPLALGSHRCRNHLAQRWDLSRGIDLVSKKFDWRLAGGMASAIYESGNMP